MTTISVLMCVYEKDEDIPFVQAIDSLIQNKKYIDNTIVIINGPISKLKSSKINNATKKLKIIKVKLKRNIGISKALNLGLKEVKTDWIARFDSDDICTKDRFKTIKNIIRNNKNEYDVIGTYIEEFNLKSNSNIIRKVPLKNNDIKKQLLFSNPINHVSVFFKSSLIKEFNEKDFYPLIDGFEDYALWVKLIFSGKIFKNIPKVSVFVRADDKMLNRRGGLKYIKNEIKFRFFIIKYIPILQIPPNLVFGLLRVLVFASPNFLKKIFYRIKRIYF